MNKKKKNKRRLIIVVAIIFIIAAAFLYFFVTSNIKTDSKVLDKIPGYEYVLEKRDTELMEENFYLLKDVLSKDKIDYKKYAEYLSKMFVIDLYTLNNKNSKYDIGGTEFIYNDTREMFKQKAQDTLYNYLKPSKKLPEVATIKNNSIEDITYEYDKKKYNGYKIELTWEYISKNDYDKKATITVINIDKKLYIANITPEVNS